MKNLIALGALLLVACSPAPAVTMKEFDSLAAGDTLSQVRSKLGDSGVKLSETGQYQTWQFINGDGSNAVVTIGDNGMILKAQAGLE